MPNENIEDVYRLSPLQEGLLFHTVYAPEAAFYLAQFGCRLANLDAEAFERAWQSAIDRHPALRTGFLWKGIDHPLQVVGRRVGLPVERRDWRGLSQEEREREYSEYLEQDRKQGFRIARAPLMRIALFREADKTYRFVWTLHHLIMDGWSKARVVKEVMQHYEAEVSGRRPSLQQPRPYKEYIKWLEKVDLSKAEQYWRNEMSGARMTRIAGRRDRAQEGTADNAEQRIYLSEEETGRLQAAVRNLRVTMSTLMEAGWALLLGRHCGDDEVVYGVTVSGRPARIEGVEDMIGMFINTLPMRVSIKADMAVGEWLRLLQQKQVQMREYEYTPLVKVNEWSGVEKGAQLFEYMTVYENYPIDFSSTERRGGLEISDAHQLGRINYPLIMLAGADRQLCIRIEYDRQHFTDASVTRMLDHLRTIVFDIVANPKKPLRSVSMLSPAETRKILVDWNDTYKEFNLDPCLHQLIEQQVERNSTATALIFEGQELSYGELNARANQLARHLRAVGVGPETRVGVCLDRSIEMVVALCAVLKSGGAYVPLDPSLPGQRLSFMLEDAQAAVAISLEGMLDLLKDSSARAVCLDQDRQAISRYSTENLNVEVLPDNIAYVIYTSGSTGKPKGAMNAHRGICNRLLWMQETFLLTQSDAVLQKTPFSFDVSVWEFFWPLLAGARLVVARPGGHQDSDYLARLIAQHNITTIHFVPSMLQMFLEEASADDCKSLRRVISSGEALRFEVQQKFFSRLRAGLYNLYGPTEAAVDVTWWPCDENSDYALVPLGKPIANIQTYILDEQLQPVPAGCGGELFLGGIGLARGYFNRPDLTAERFIPNLFGSQAGARLYRTGDLARFLDDGAIEFLGRNDFQVKVRGFRIEIGEIEAAVMQHDDVKDAVVIAREEPSGEKRLIAYVVFKSEREASINQLRSHLAAQLPDYCVPSGFVVIERIPLTYNGKVDRQALPAPGAARQETEKSFVAPRNHVEQRLAELWADLLKIDRAGIEDNFFELGGHSLLMMQLASRIRKIFKVDLPFRMLFDGPTILEMSKAILANQLEQADTKKVNASQQSIDEAKSLPPAAAPMHRQYPLSFAQRRLWFLQQIAPANPFYNMHTAARLTGVLNIAALEKSLTALVSRHEILRTTFECMKDEPYQVVHPPSPLKIPVNDLTSFPETERGAEVARMAKVDAETPFDLLNGPLIRLTLLRTDEHEHVLLSTMHHIISDGWSMRVLVRELATLYESYLYDREPALPDLPLQYADYSAWQHDYLTGERAKSDLEYWKRKLGGRLPVLEVAPDRDRPSKPSYKGGRVPVRLSPETAAALAQVCRSHGATVFITALAGFIALLHLYTGELDILIGTPVSNRDREEFEGLIGLFLNTVVIRADLSGNPTFSEIVRRVRSAALEAFDHQNVPFEKIVEELGVERDASRNPIFQVWFVMQSGPQGAASLPGLTISPLDIRPDTTLFDLMLDVEDRNGEVSGFIRYNDEIYNMKSIERMARRFETLMNQVSSNPASRLNEIDIDASQGHQSSGLYFSEDLEAEMDF